jgi:hypothetical protein
VLLQAGPQGCTLGTVQPSKALKITVAISKNENSATLRLTATNVSEDTVDVRFNTSQRIDFLGIEEASKRVLWRWSHNQQFTEALATEDFRPGESKTYDAVMPYVGLPPTQYEIFGFLTLSPKPIKALESVKLDLTDKQISGPFELHIVAEVQLDRATASPTVYLQSLHGVKYKIVNPPQELQSAFSFPIEAWLNQKGSDYQLVDYTWVMAPLSENAQLFLPDYVLYTKAGGIAGIFKGIKIYGDGSFMAHCCQGFEQVKTGHVGALEPIWQFMTAERLGDYKTRYGKPGVVADGFAEVLIVKNRKFYKEVFVYTDPADSPPAGFGKIANRLNELVKLPGF